jgi:hypothetical protein
LLYPALRNEVEIFNDKGYIHKSVTFVRYSEQMFAYLIRVFLKLTNRSYLIQFFNGLTFIGKPTDVLYPVELLDQASLLCLSGLNNTLAIQSNQHWIWPYWVERQLNPDTDEFIPTGVNLLTNNLSFRNWTALSIYGNRLEAMMDPVGMLTMEPFSWSVMPYLIADNQYFIPSKMKSSKVRQKLHKNNWPEVITHYKTNTQIQWISKCKALEIDQQQVIHLKYILKNQSDTTSTFIFGLTIRPYNPLTIGHIHKLSCKKNLWKVNGRPAMLMLEPADYIHCSNRLLGDPIYCEHIQLDKNQLQQQSKTKLKSRSGISAGIAAYKITLEPGQSLSFEFLLTDKHNSVLEIRKKSSHWYKQIQLAEKRFKQSWKNWSATGISIQLPDQKLQQAFESVKNHLCVFDDIDQFTPGSFFYHSGWFRDSAFLSLGFDQAGYFNQVKNKFTHYFKQQTFSGYFKSQNGEWDSTGQALFTIISHIRRSGDIQLLKKHYNALLKGAKWISKTRLNKIDINSPHFGLLPAGISAEHFGPNDYYFWDNFWSLTGIQQLIWAADLLNHTKDSLWLQSVYDSYFQDLQKSINHVTSKSDCSALSCSPYRWTDTAAIGNLAAITPMNLISENEYWVAPTLDFLWSNNVRNGLFFQHIIHTGFNIYLSIQLAKVFLIRQDPRWKVILEAVLDAASGTWTWPEAIHPRTGGGCMGDGDHGWAAAEFISLIRDMFVFENQNRLYLGAGIFSKWFDLLETDIDHKNHPLVCSDVSTTRHSIKLNNASTLFGTVSYVIQKQNTDIILEWKITRNALQERVPVYFICTKLLQKYTVSDNVQTNKEQTQVQLLSETGHCMFNLKKSVGL